MKATRVLVCFAASILALGCYVPWENDALQPLVFQHYVTSKDGIKLNTLYIPAVNQKPNAPTVMCAHGASHHLGKLRPTMLALAHQGYNVIGIDCRGHGKSGGLRGDVPNFDYLVEDFMSAYTFYKSAIRGSLFTLSHSAGSLTVVRMLQERNIPVTASILLAPCLGLSSNVYWGHRKAFLALLRSTNPTYKVELSTRSPRVFEPIDDEHTLKTVTVRSLHEVVKHSRYALRKSNQISSAIHILIPEHDDVVDNKKTERFFNSLPAHIKKSITVHKNTPHTMLDSQDKHLIHQKIFSLLEQHRAPTKTTSSKKIA